MQVRSRPAGYNLVEYFGLNIVLSSMLGVLVAYFFSALQLHGSLIRCQKCENSWLCSLRRNPPYQRRLYRRWLVQLPERKLLNALEVLPCIMFEASSEFLEWSDELRQFFLCECGGVSRVSLQGPYLNASKLWMWLEQPLHLQKRLPNGDEISEILLPLRIRSPNPITLCEDAF